MEYRQLGNTEFTFSSIGTGGVTFGREIDREQSFQVLDYALDRGITLFDTAESYAADESEQVVGEWIASRGIGDQIVLATKVGGELTRDRDLTSAEESLRRLKVETVERSGNLHG